MLEHEILKAWIFGKYMSNKLGPYFIASFLNYVDTNKKWSNLPVRRTHIEFI